MDKYTSKPRPMATLTLRSSSCKYMGRPLPQPPFPQRSTSLPRLPPTPPPVSGGFEALPATTYVPPLINKQLSPLTASACNPPSLTEKLELLPKTVSVPLSASKDLPTLPATAYTQDHSRKLSKGSRISHDPSNLHHVERRSVTLETPTRTHSSLLSAPAPASPLLRKKASRSPLLPPDEIEFESLVLVTVQPPTPGTATPKPIATATSAPTSIKAMSKPDVLKLQKRNLATTKMKTRQSMVLASKVARSVDGGGRRTSFYRSPKKVKHDSSNLYCKDYGKRYGKSYYLSSHAPQLPRIDSSKSIFHMIQRPAEATSSPPTSVPKITFEQMYLQILEERWAYYRQLNAIREADVKREVEEYIAAHPVACAPVTATTLCSAPPSGRRPERQAHRETRTAWQAKKLPAIAEGDGEKSEKMATKTTKMTMKREKRVTVSSPHLFRYPLSPREKLQQEKQKLKNCWRDWLRSGQRHDRERRKLTKKRGDTTTEDELKSISAYS